jgi:hypothetical protein
MNIVYIVVKSAKSGVGDYNVIAYTSLVKALDRCKEEENNPDNKFFSYWVDTIGLNKD